MQKLPLFISGIGRSGTSAVISSLAKHKQVVEPQRIGEAPIVSHFIKFLIDYEDKSPEREYHLQNYQLDSLGRSLAYSKLLSSLQYGFDIDSAEEPANLWIAKVSLGNAAYKKAVEVFDELRIIYVMRNGIEVVNSAKSFHGFANLSFEQLCKRWSSNIQQCRYAHSADLCAVVRHDELVTDPMSVYKEVYRKLRMEQDSAPADFISTTLFNSSFDKSAAGFSTAKVFNNRLACWDDWSSKEKNTFIETCDSLMEEFDFQRPYAGSSTATPTKISPKSVMQTLRQNKSLASKQTNQVLKGIVNGHMSINQFDYYTNVSKKNKYVFLENPKVASTSLLRSLQAWEDSGSSGRMYSPHDRNDSPIAKLSDFNSEEQAEFFTSDEYFRFTFVRHPLTRILSAYLSKIEKPLKPKAEILGIIKGIKSSEVVNLKEKVDFPTFVEVVCSQQSMNMNSHWKAQVDQIMFGKIDYAFIGRFERLSADFGYVANTLFPDKKMGLTQSENKTSSNSKFDSYYTPELIDQVYNKFYDDFQAFEYSKMELEKLTA